MHIPSDDEIRSLHRRHAPNPEAFELVYTHCEIVARIAAQLAGPDPLVRAGALLHDIGVYRLYRPSGEPDFTSYIRHGLLGHELLREAGLPETLCRFCSCHTGVGITREDIERQELPLPPGDYVAVTSEEQIVMYADKFHSKKSPPIFVSAATYTAGVKRFGEDKAAAFTAMVDRYGEPGLHDLAAEYGHAIT
ncbi:HD domain-containing protein [Actinoplanes sp. TFC3]|uniref:HD domain-containing protein n=1 Tax=Actinoplanes sp. TFC3 TaxID=1710355 RepID=UPI00082B7C41|nr:HD domain-containing protein [Actinoplanes sp. TFC3]